MYKVTFYSPINRIFSSWYGKHKGLKHAKNSVAILNECAKENIPLQLPRYRGNYDNISFEEYKYAKQMLHLLESTDSYRTRTEYSTLNVYLEHEEDLTRFTTDKVVRKHIHEIWKPDLEDIKHLTAEENIFLLKEPSPYEYRIYMKNGNRNPELAKWLKANSDKTKITEYGLYSLSESKWSNIYFYVRDEKLLFFVQMLAGQNIQKVERLVYQGNTDK